MIILWLIIIGIIIYFIWQMLFSVKLKLQTVNFYSGGLGSGKTLKATDTAIKLQRKAWLLNKLTFGLVKEREIYSNYPILIKKRKGVKTYSKILRKGHILGTEKLPEKCIVVLDEASSIFPNQTKKSEEEVTYAFRWFRHWTDGTLILADQSIGDIDIAVRRRVNIVYNFSGFRKLPYICYWIDVNKINYMEDIVVNINDINNLETKSLFGFFGKRRFNSRYMSLFYNPLEMEIKEWDDLKIKPEISKK